MKRKILRITTVPTSFKHLLNGQMMFMSENGFEIIMVSSYGPEIQELIKAEKCKHETIPLTRKITPIKDLLAIFKLIILITRIKPDIVHTHTPKAGMIGMISAFLARVPNRLHTIAGLPLLETTGVKRKLLKIVEKATYSCATHIYPNSVALKEIVINERFCKPSKLKVLGQGSSNGINTAYFNPENFSKQQKEDLKTRLGIYPNDFIFIYLGRLVKDKGINELIESFSKINHCNAKLLLVGGFESDLDPLKKGTVKEIENNKNIISTGYQKDVRPYLAISNCLVFPSYREGFPNAVMQAGAMRLPCIVTNINGCNEIIEDKKNGLIIPSKDIIKLEQAMRSIMENRKLYKQLESNSREMITSRYEQKLVWEAILTEYKSLKM